jgi:hypothetical protein
VCFEHRHCCTAAVCGTSMPNCLGCMLRVQVVVVAAANDGWSMNAFSCFQSACSDSGINAVRAPTCLCNAKIVSSAVINTASTSVSSVKPQQAQHTQTRSNSHSLSLMAPSFHTTQNVAIIRLIDSRKLRAMACSATDGSK